MRAWFAQHAEIFALLALVSALGLVLALLLAPWVLAGLPADYFVAPVRASHARSEPQPSGRVFVRLARNVVGALLVALGLMMLVLPGQGVVTVLAGLLLMHFPGRTRLIRFIACRPVVMGPLNRLRVRLGKLPFEEAAE